MKIDHVDIGSKRLPGAAQRGAVQRRVGDNARLGALTLVMKGEHIPAGKLGRLSRGAGAMKVTVHAWPGPLPTWEDGLIVISTGGGPRDAARESIRKAVCEVWATRWKWCRRRAARRK